MILRTETGEKVEAKATKRPTFSGYKGATWDNVYFHIDGEKVIGKLDFTWGRNIYFEHGGKWYALGLYSDIGESEKQMVVANFLHDFGDLRLNLFSK